MLECMSQSNGTSAPPLGIAIRHAREQTPGLTIRELGRLTGISHTQLGRIEAGEIATPARDTLVTLARALDRNPVPLLILAGHLAGDEARIALRPMFRDGAELPEEWGEWASFPLDEARALVRNPDADDDQLRRLAADVFAVAETDETLWDESHTLLLAHGDRDLLQLVGIWRFVRGDRRQQLLDYARALRKLEDMEWLAEADRMRLDVDVVVGESANSGADLDRSSLEDRGFEGFVRIRALQRGCPTVPALPGIYVVLRLNGDDPDFVETSVGGYFKGQDPTVGTDRLRQKWLLGPQVVYVGRGGNLRKRLDLLARFSRGEAVGHWGGRFLWQLADHDELLVAWLTTADHEGQEAELIAEFVAAYGGLPFANLNQPRLP
jgi:transcriptional regulator with XRE-family HTH domain